MFQLFSVDAFRIETRDRYDVAAEAPAIAEFEATGRIIIYQGKQDYLDLITDNAAAGRTIRRVHTVHASRLTAYLRWEFASQTATNVPAGEDPSRPAVARTACRGQGRAHAVQAAAATRHPCIGSTGLRSGRCDARLSVHV
jgi:hypothetical protein